MCVHVQRLLTRRGPVQLQARDIVDAHRDVTLGLLWTIANKQVSSPVHCVFLEL